MVLANRLREYLEYIAIARNLSPLTVKANKHTLGKFCELYGSVEASTLEFATMQDWMFIQGDQLNFHGRKKTPSTINTERAIVRAFLRYCRNSGDRLLFDPASMTNMKCRIKSRSVIKPEEILNVARAITNEKVRLLTLVTFFGGLRIGEAIKLRPSDIDGTVLLIQDSKSVDPRPAFIPQELIDEVWQYINKHRITTGRIFEYGTMLDSAHYERYTTGGARSQIQKYFAKQGYKITPHELRHSFASMLHRNGADIYDIKELLGHSDVRTTQLYIHVERHELAGTHTKYSIKY